MLIHLVSFKYKPDVDSAGRRDHRARLKRLAAIPGVIELKVGEDVVRSPRSYDTGLLVKFPDRAAFDAYQAHPDHLPVIQFGASICENIVAVDFVE
jgi:hypothetical protein